MQYTYQSTNNIVNDRMTTPIRVFARKCSNITQNKDVTQNKATTQIIGDTDFWLPKLQYSIIITAGIIATIAMIQ